MASNTIALRLASEHLIEFSHICQTNCEYRREEKKKLTQNVTLAYKKNELNNPQIDKQKKEHKKSDGKKLYCSYIILMISLYLHLFSFSQSKIFIRTRPYPQQPAITIPVCFNFMLALFFFCCCLFNMTKSIRNILLF